MCLNKKILVGLAVVVLGVAVVRPGFAIAALPFLILAVCPLSMIFMMRGMSGRTEGNAGAARSTSAGVAEPSHISTPANTSARDRTSDLDADRHALEGGSAPDDSAPRLTTDST